MKRDPSIVGTLLFMLAGPIVWAAHLGVAYGAHAILCAVGLSVPSALSYGPLVLTLASAIAALAVAVLLLWPRRIGMMLGAPDRGEQASFALNVGRLLSFLSLCGVVYFGIAMALLPVCRQLR